MARGHSLLSFAREMGRFDMRLTPEYIQFHKSESELSLERFMALCLHAAASFHVFTGYYRRLPGLVKALERAGKRSGGGWTIDAPAHGNLTLWRRVLESDMPVVLEAPSERWIRRCIAQLHRPLVYMHSPLTTPAFRHCKRVLTKSDNTVLVAFGVWRDTFSFCGTGPWFESALKAMSRRPPGHRWFDEGQRRNMLKHGHRMTRALPRDLR